MRWSQPPRSLSSDTLSSPYSAPPPSLFHSRSYNTYGIQWQLPVVVAYLFISADCEAVVEETERSFQIHIHRYIFCVTSPTLYINFLICSIVVGLLLHLSSCSLYCLLTYFFNDVGITELYLFVTFSNYFL